METLWFPKKAADVLEDNYLATYERDLSEFFSQLVRFNTNIFILDKLVSFPFDLFGDHDGDIFFSMVAMNSFETCILLIYKILRDSDDTTYSIQRFRNDIARHVKPLYETEYKVHLKRSKIERKAEGLLEKADYVRNNRIAHLNKTTDLSHPGVPTINLGEIHQIQKGLNSLFKSIGFESDYILLPIPYDPSVSHPVGSDNRADIERILDRIARESPLLNLPESNPLLWKSYRQRVKQHDLERLNLYRQRFNMTLV
jgi:hypothetical protein